MHVFRTFIAFLVFVGAGSGFIQIQPPAPLSPDVPMTPMPLPLTLITLRLLHHGLHLSLEHTNILLIFLPIALLLRLVVKVFLSTST